MNNQILDESYDASLNRTRVTKARELLNALYLKVCAFQDEQKLLDKNWQFCLDLRCEIAGLMGLMGGELEQNPT